MIRNVQTSLAHPTSLANIKNPPIVQFPNQVTFKPVNGGDKW